MITSREIKWMRRQTLLSLVTLDLRAARRRLTLWRALSQLERLLAARQR